MISAKQAREKTESNRLTLTRASVEKSIKKAIENGRDEIRISGAISAEIITELKENGYTVEELNGLTKIRW